MREASFYKKSAKGFVDCFLCPRYCHIKSGSLGFCRARKNIDGKLFSLVYGSPCSVNVDPIEKKPLFHFLPGSNIFSVGATGCNLKCRNCQNFEISQACFEDVPSFSLPPEMVVEKAISNDYKSIAFTYTEPTIAGEYVIDTAKLARKRGLKTVLVTNGYTSEESFDALYENVDAANVDLKGFSEEFYKKVASAKLRPVLDTLLRIKKKKTVWLEITNLLIPGLNDDEKMIKKMCKWIVKNLGPDVPLHFSRFFSMYQLTDVPSTPEDSLLKARKIAFDAGLHFVYVGNVRTEKGEYTLCPVCKDEVIGREGFSVIENKIKNNKCVNGHLIAGVWN